MTKVIYLLISFALSIIAPIYILVILARKEKFNFKYCLLGVLCFFINRNIIYSLINNLLFEIFVIQSDVLKTYLQAFILALTDYAFVYFVYPLFNKNNNDSNNISLGYGRALIEIITTIAPYIFIYFVWQIKSLNNELLHYFVTTGLTDVEAQAYLVAFEGYSASYFLYTGVCGITILSIQMFASYFTHNQNKDYSRYNILSLFLYIVFYLTCAIGVNASYYIACLLMVFVTVYCLQKIRVCIEGEKNDYNSHDEPRNR